jgi:hypothetical protein
MKCVYARTYIFESWMVMCVECVCVCVCVYIYIHTYIHTDTHVHSYLHCQGLGWSVCMYMFTNKKHSCSNICTRVGKHYTHAVCMYMYMALLHMYVHICTLKNAHVYGRCSYVYAYMYSEF